MTETEINELKLKETQFVKYILESETKKGLDTRKNLQALFKIRSNAINHGLNGKLAPGSLKLLAFMIIVRQAKDFHSSRIEEFDKKKLYELSIKEIEALKEFFNNCIIKLGLYLPPDLSLRLENSARKTTQNPPPTHRFPTPILVETTTKNPTIKSAE